MKIKTNKFLTLTLLAGAFMFAACAQKDKPEDATEVAEEQNEAKFEDTEIENDTEWAVAVADMGMLEVEASKLALERATTPSVKQFAQTMVDEHSKANEELKTAASQKNISLPAALSEKSQKKLDDLREKSGKDFEDAYTDCMVKDHKDAVDKFKKQAEKGEDADLKSWAAGKVATLENHLEMAKAIEKTVDEIK
jgi:putative membrane protein